MSPMPRKELEQHRLAGTKPQYIDDAAEDETLRRPKYPKGITPEARRVFKRLVDLLSRRKTLTEADGELLRLYAVTFDRHRRALEHLTAEGEVCSYERLDSHGQPHTFFKENLHLKIASDCEKYMRAVLGDCGLNPVSRGKVKVSAPKIVEPEAFPSREEMTLPEPEIDLSQLDETKVVQ